MKSTRIALLGLLALGAFACSSILGLEDFQFAPTEDASLGNANGPDTSLDIDADETGSLGDADATVEEPGPINLDGGSDGDARSALDAIDGSRDALGERGADGAAESSCAMTLCGTECVDTSRWNTHCGSCDAACPANSFCQASTCVCALGFHDCSGVCSNNLSSNSCGPTSCAPCAIPFNGLSSACTDAGCGVCASTLVLCNANTSDAACVDITTDTAHCGACGTACRVPDGGGAPTCSGTPPTCGMACNTGLTACPAVNPQGCFDLTSDIRHCGTCSTRCPAHDSGTAATCVSGGCR